MTMLGRTLIVVLLLPLPLLSADLLDRVVAYSDQGIVITLSQLILAKLQQPELDKSPKDMLRALIKQEAIIFYIKRANLVHVRFQEIEQQYSAVMASGMRDVIEAYRLDPGYVKIAIEKQILYRKFMQNAVFSNILVTREDIESFIEQHADYQPADMTTKLDEILQQIKARKISEKIDRDIEPFVQDMHILLKADQIAPWLE